jgi:C-terminal processing protease CtpA/Prc
VRLVLTAALVLGVWIGSCAQAQTTEAYRQDFDRAIRQIASQYCYFDAKSTRWSEIRTLYGPDLDRVASRDDFIALLERLLDELYDPHAQLTVNLERSYRLVPSGTDLWAEWRDGRAMITQVRPGSDAQRAGIKPNDIVIAIDGTAIDNAVDARMGRSYPHSDSAARDWALRSVLAGRHNLPRRLQLAQGGEVRMLELPGNDRRIEAGAVLTASEIRPGIGYIRFNDSLGNSLAIGAFDHALDGFRETRGLIVDLRDTPSGGNSSVARAILGRFVKREQPYQKHVLPSEERETGVRRSWLELVSPRGAFPYLQPVVVLVDHWTGSMGEGLAIGFDATRSARIVGTPMAGLAGATYRVTLPRTGIGINLPAEQLYHVDGRPREAFKPTVAVEPEGAGAGQDPFIVAALRVLERR